MNTGEIFVDLMHLAAENGITVKFVPFRAHYAMLHNDRIGLSQSLDSIDDLNYNIAHELAHYYLHSGKGDIMPGSIDEEALAQYEEQADRGARMLLDALAVKQKCSAIA